MELKFDLKAKAEEVVEKIQADPSLLKSFQSDPIKTIERLLMKPSFSRRPQNIGDASTMG